MTGFRLRLRGKAAVFVDWANVYGWKKSLKREVVVYASGHIGREIWGIRRGLFKVNIENMGL